MLRESRDEMIACGLPHALEVMGERWSFMILRASFNGVRHFEEFLSALGIARNILSNRLAKLVEHGILGRERCPDDRRKVEYRVTEKGLDLLPALLALKQWGEKHKLTEPANPVVVDTRDWQPISPIRILAHDGRELSYRELRWQERSKLALNADRTPGEA